LLKKTYRILAAASGLWLILSALGVHAYLIDTIVRVPPNYYTFQPPARGESYTDPVFGTTIKRISDARHTAHAEGAGYLTFITNEYSTMNPFNRDNSRLILQHHSYFALYDGAGTFLRDLPFEVHASSQPRWSRSDPSVLYYINGNSLKKMNVETRAITVIHTFSEYGEINGHGESDISMDGDHFVFSGDRREVFVYQISTDTKGPVLDTAGHAFDALYITPDNNVTVTYYETNTTRFSGVELYDRNMVFQRQLAHASGHQDFTRDTDGTEVLLWINSGDPWPLANCPNGIEKIRLRDGHKTCVVTFEWGQAVHVSGTDNTGWFILETYVPADPSPTSGWGRYANEILQIRIDGSEVRRLLHHRSRPFDSYWYTPRPAVSRDGSRMVFASNYGLQAQLGYPSEYIDTYLVTLGASPAPTPTPTPGPTPTPTPTPTPPPPGGTRIQESHPAVVYTGGAWSDNSLSVHSGGAARLTADAGARANLAFSGTSISWIGYRDRWSGIARVYLDGALVATVDTYAASDQAQAVLFSRSGLPAGAHMLVVEATGQHSAGSSAAWVWVDGFDIGNAAPSWSRFEQNRASVAWGGAWNPSTHSTHSGGTASLTATATSFATFTFHGQRARWIGRKNAASGIAMVLLDGTHVANVDSYSATVQPQALLYTTPNLGPGTHTLTIYATGTKRSAATGPWVWVDAFEVYR
jgi:hypothetical protein